jgi:flagellar motor switch protein FliN/FliY
MADEMIEGQQPEVIPSEEKPKRILFGTNVSTEPKKKKDRSVEIGHVKLPSLDKIPLGEGFEQDMFGRIPVEVTVELGRTSLSLKEVLEMAEGSILELDHLVGEPLSLYVNEQLIAQGEVVTVDDKYGLKVTNLIAKK